MSIKRGMLVEMVPWLYENEGEDCSMLVPGDSYPGKLYGIVLDVTLRHKRKNLEDQWLAEVLFNDGNIVKIAATLIKELQYED